jgi:glycine/D-amino acid oxidase-like deaminating enzyme
LSYWLEDGYRPSLAANRLDGRVDVAIVGAGVTGCSCALTLAEAGRRVRVHEAREVAGGASGRNGGFALRGLAIAYDVARERLGRERATELWLLTERTIDRLELLAGDAFRRKGSLKLAAAVDEATCLRREYDALREDGFDAEWLDDLEPQLRGRYSAGLVHPRDGAIQPARWVRRLASRAAAAGADIREGDSVESLDKLDADTVVVATDGYTHGLVAELDAAVRPTRGQVVATAPLPERPFPRPHYTYDGYVYWHQLEDGRLVLGGFRDRALGEEWTREETTTPAIQSALDGFARELVGEVEVVKRWAGIFGSTDDHLPLVGRLPGDERVWASCGYSGHGNVMGLACGDLVARAILGEASPLLETFDPARAWTKHG